MNGNRNRWDRLAQFLLIVLAVLALAEAAWLVARLHSPADRVTWVPLYRSLVGEQRPESDRSFALESDAELERVVARQVGTVGEALTIEDLVRGIAALEARGALTDDKKRSIAPLLREAQRLRREILACQEEMTHAETELRRQARSVVTALTPAQRVALVAQRDQLAMKGMEAPYWNALIEALSEEAGESER